MKATMFGMALFIAMVPGSAMAAESCKSVATDKRLAGAALNSFMTKCERDMKASCAVQASDRKIYGAAKTSFTNKCVKDSVGT